MWTYAVGHIFLLLVAVSAQQTVTVQSRVGDIMGIQETVLFGDSSKHTVSKFLAIPYGESTAGKNRFRKPIPKAPFSGIFDARNLSMACFQSKPEFMKEVGERVPGFTEDCLTLNIYVPHDMNSRDLLPVMLWIHGGGFQQGAASEYNPETLSVLGNVIVVTINYRLGMFGFLKDESGQFPGNLGLWDQHLAIKWVHENIDNFYGYKGEITIFGESAGGAAVLFQAIYPGNRGLFKRVIAQSGSPLANWATTSTLLSERYFKNVGCPAEDNRLTCMQAKSPTDLMSANITFRPIVDGDFLVQSPLEILLGNDSKSAEARDFYGTLDIMSGVNSVDGALFLLLIDQTANANITSEKFSTDVVPPVLPVGLNDSDKDIITKLVALEYTSWTDPEDFTAIRKSTLRLLNDGVFFAPALAALNVHSFLKKGGISYFYEFDLDSDLHVLPTPSWVKGSNHGDEMPFVLGLPLLHNIPPFGGRVNYTTAEEMLSRTMVAMWSNFAKSGNPNVPMDLTRYINSTWPAYTIMSQKFFELSEKMSPMSVKDHLHARAMTFWTEVIYPLMLRLIQRCEMPKIFHFDPVFIG